MRHWQLPHAVATVSCLVWLLLPTAAGQEQAPDPDAMSLVERIIGEEALIRDICGHLEITNTGTGRTYASIDWGSDGGREYYRGLKSDPIPVEHLAESLAKDAAVRPYWEVEVASAFDGERMRIFRKCYPWRGDHFGKEPDMTGRVAPLEHGTFTVLSLHMLTGQSISGVKRLPLGRALQEAREVRVWRQMDEVEGHECRVLEALGFLGGASLNDYGLRAWIDVGCGFRPRRLEMHIRYPGGPPWGVLYYRVDRIRLQQVDGFWIPVEGVQEGFDPAESRKAAQTGGKLEPMVPPLHYVVHVPSVRINKGIARSMFTVDFPPGTKVLDEFLDGQTYQVGWAPSVDGAPLGGGAGSPAPRPMAGGGPGAPGKQTEATPVSHSGRDGGPDGPDSRRRDHRTTGIALCVVVAVLGGVIYVLVKKGRTGGAASR